MRRIHSLLWKLANALQAVHLVLWSVLWISVALAAAALAGRRAGLALARRVWAPGLLAAVPTRLEVVRGREHAASGRPCLFVANHQSWLDILALFLALPVPLLFVAKRELGRVPFLGWYMRAMGMVLLDREDRLQAGRSLAAAAARLVQGYSLLSFPEGTRSRDGRVQRFKKGTFGSAVAAGAPVVPVALDGPGEILPRGTFRVRPGPLRVAIGEPIPTTGLAPPDRADLARRAQAAVEELLAELRGERGAAPLPGAAGRVG